MLSWIVEAYRRFLMLATENGKDPTEVPVTADSD